MFQQAMFDCQRVYQAMFSKGQNPSSSKKRDPKSLGATQCDPWNQEAEAGGGVRQRRCGLAAELIQNWIPKRRNDANETPSVGENRSENRSQINASY